MENFKHDIVNNLQIRGVDTGGDYGVWTPQDINNKSLMKIKFLSILVYV